MDSGVHVVCTDEKVAARITSWLNATRLDPPAPLILDVTVSDLVPDDADSRPPFTQPHLEIRAGPPSGDVRIRWLAAPALSVLPAGEGVAHVTLSRAALELGEALEATFLTATLALLMRRAGWHHVHAAIARDPKGRDWLFAGNSGSGKSTTAALLATRGWGIGGDDLVFLTRSGTGVEAVAARAPIALRPGGAALLGRSTRRSGEGRRSSGSRRRLSGEAARVSGEAARASGDSSRASGTFSRRSAGFSVKGGRKMAFFPEDLGGTWTPRACPTIVMLPRVGAARTRLSPVAPRDKLAELVRWSALVVVEADRAQAHLDLLAQLVRQADCWRLDLGPDLFGGRDLLMELVP